MKAVPLDIPEVLVIEPDVLSDERGFFLESWQRKKFADIGIDYDFVQDNHSRSLKGTLRGLHYQLCHPQGKLVRVTAGQVFDVAVDLRRGSPTFGQWVGEYLTAENFRMMWVPPGFAHGFYVVSETAEFQYKCTDYYAPECERSIHWNDPDLAIEWPVSDESGPILSSKDEQAPRFRDADLYEALS